MRPLRDEKKTKNPAMRRAAELLAKAAPETRAAPAWMKQRVRARLLSAERPRRRAWMLQAAAALVVLGLATAAAAGIGRRWIERNLLGRAPQAAPVSAVPAAASPSGTREVMTTPRVVPAPVAIPPEPPVRVERPAMHPSGRAVRGGVAATAPEPKSSAPIAPAEVVKAAPAPAPVPAEEPKAVAPPAGVAAKTALDDDDAPAAAVAARPEEQDTKLVVDALKLRVRDPARAGELLDEYLRRQPHGVLEEQALGVAIEAAAARNDPAAARYAATYLKRHPDGRFAAAARNAIARFAR